MFFKSLKTILFLFFLLSISSSILAQELSLEQNKLYLLTFNDNIQNFYSNKDCLESQLVNTIYSSNQLLLLLKKEEGVLQVKTEKDFYKFVVKKGTSDDYENLIKIDSPSDDLLILDLPKKLGEK